MNPFGQQIDSKYFEELYSKHFSAVACFVSTYLYDKSKAEDIAQKAFMHLWEHRDELDPNNSVKSYLYTSAKNITLDYLRHQKIKERYICEQMESVECIDRDLNIEALSILRDEEIEKSLKIKKIKKIILDLPLSDRKIFILSKFNNLTYTEIAELLGISVKTVEKRISISLKFLRKRITIFIFVA